MSLLYFGCVSLLADLGPCHQAVYLRIGGEEGKGPVHILLPVEVQPALHKSFDRRLLARIGRSERQRRSQGNGA